MRRLGIVCVVIACSVLATQGFAQRDGAARGKAAKKRGPAPGAAQRPVPDPQQIAARMIKNFDKDGDGALNARELTAAITALRKQRGGQRDGAAGRKRGGPGADRPGARAKGGAKRGARDGAKPGAKDGARRPPRPAKAG